jgi:hypothetical protein
VDLELEQLRGHLGQAWAQGKVRERAACVWTGLRLRSSNISQLARCDMLQYLGNVPSLYQCPRDDVCLPAIWFTLASLYMIRRKRCYL